MSEGVAVALIGATAVVLAALLTTLAAVVPLFVRRLNAIRDQVANDHRKPDGTPLNLRDDLDGKHAENYRILGTIQRDVAWIMRQLVDTNARLDHHIEETTEGRKRP